MQQQYDESSKQRVLAIEVQQPTPDKRDGVAVLPFGLALERGVTWQIDSTPLVVTARYRTCLPAGCLVPLSLDSK
ncbi:invasion associated locus B family protein, partial [Acinetobacter baumannii]|uniref:invasion associated locus B family protein n=1 Tax=Acinetobacter baumannii TaxID=470 RepID=UPI001D171E55